MTNGETQPDGESANLLRFSHDLVAKKFNTMALVNGFFFAAFNVLNYQQEVQKAQEIAVSFFDEQATLCIVGIAFSLLWWFNIERSIAYTEHFKSAVQELNPKTGFMFWQLFPARHVVRVGVFGQMGGWLVLFIRWINPTQIWWERLIGAIVLILVSLVILTLVGKWIDNRRAKKVIDQLEKEMK